MITDVNRYLTILRFGVKLLVTDYMYALVLIFVTLIINRSYHLSLPFLVISSLLLVYFIIYLTTPYDLNWHLYTSLYRLYQHVYPALIYLCLLSFKNVKTIPVLNQHSNL